MNVFLAFPLSIITFCDIEISICSFVRVDLVHFDSGWYRYW